MAEGSINRGLSVRRGFFPQVIQPHERFDIIVFNDVFEHLPDVLETLEACRVHLNDEGLLVLNLPNSKGLIYNISKILKKLGLTYFFERMWQKNLPSPHLHYFNHGNLNTLLNNSGFTELTFGYLDVFYFKGFFDRIMAIKNVPKYVKFLAYAGVVIILPLRLVSNDIMYLIARKGRKDTITLQPDS